MLLAIDVGNTHIVLGIFKADELIVNWRLFTDQERTCDEYGIFFQNLFASKSISLRLIKSIIISCVVPQVMLTFDELCRKYFQKKPMVVGPGVKTGLTILYDNPAEVGADRIVNAVAAFHKYRQSLIIIDFGTATTFDYISGQGEYVGGAIAPGIAISSEALFHRASKLPRVEFSCPKTVIGRDTITSMQSGIVFGYMGLVDGIVGRIKGETNTNPFVVATGGLASLIASKSETIDEVDEYLTLKGLKIIYRMNSLDKS